MKLPYAQLTTHLSKNLAAIYLISSDELLLVQEAIETIRAAAMTAGFNEQTTITPETGMEWSHCLYSDAHSLSLFATKKIIILNLSQIKLSAAQGKILEEYALAPPKDTVLIVHTHKLDTKTEKTVWYKNFEKNAVVIPLWPISIEQLPAWILQRAKKINLNMTKQAAERLAVLVEGNLLAAAQEIEKLYLLHTTDVLDHTAIEKMVTDHAHFDIFNLVDCVLSGNNQRSLRILQSLADDDTEPTLILWALTRELRTMAEIQKQMQQGGNLGNLFSQFRIWEKRQASVRAFLQRNKLPHCWSFLLKAAKIDRIIKGLEKGNIWDELTNFVLKITGSNVIME